jgi:hypothetical protein
MPWQSYFGTGCFYSPLIRRIFFSSNAILCIGIQHSPKSALLIRIFLLIKAIESALHLPQG